MIRFSSAVDRLVARPWQHGIAVVLLGTAVGFQAGVMGAVSTVLFRPLPFRGFERIAVISEHRDGANLPTTWRNYQDWQERSNSFARLGAFAERPALLMDSREPAAMRTAFVDSAFFDVLGVNAAEGRFFSPEEEQGHAAVAIISHAVWRQHFGAAVDIERLTVNLDGEPHLIVGVAPREVKFLLDADVFIPMPRVATGRGQRVVHVVGRLREGMAVDAAGRELSAIVAGLQEVDRDNAGYKEASVIPLRDALVADVQVTIMTLGVVALLLTVAVTSSLFSMQLLRFDWRQRDMVTRAALGATKWHLVGELAMESVATAVPAFLISACVAVGLRASALRLTTDPWLSQQYELGPSTYGFALLLSLVISLLIGVGSALPLPTYCLQPSLRRAAAGAGTSRLAKRLQAAVVSCQTALATVFTIAAMSVVLNIWNVARIDAGFDSAHLWLLDLKTNGGPHVAVANQGQQILQIVEALRSLPGVSSAGATNRFPLIGLPMVVPVSMRGIDTGRTERVQLRLITPGYLETLRVPLLRGRLLSVGDDESQPRVAIANEAFITKYWQNLDMTAKEVRIAFGPWFTLIGAVGDVRSTSIKEPPQPELYVSILQVSSSGEMSVALRCHDAPPTSADVRAVIRRLSSTISVGPLSPVETLLAAPERPRRFGAMLIALLAALCFTLSIVGVYSLSVEAVSRRRRELAVRLVCGATERQLTGEAVRQITALHVVGVVVGVGAVISGQKWLASVVALDYSVPPSVVAGVIALLVFAGGFATYAPARRVVYGSLAEALRTE